MSLLEVIEQVKKSPFALKAMKSAPSRDGICWSANIYRGTKKIGTVMDGGYGGPIDVDVDRMSQEEMAKLTDDPLYPEAAGIYLSELADATETFNKIKRRCRSNILIHTSGHSFRQISMKKGHTESQIRTHCAKSYPGLKIINDLF